jgi:NAD(P)-dependent dehydrogenase (short-subunit alcohol dehydrogenase family)
VVAITGGARGIGLATARAFAATGATVAIGDVDADLAATVAADLGGHGHPLDVRDRTSFAAFLDAVGPVDVLVNNAGVAPAGRFLDTDPALVDLVVEVNLRVSSTACASPCPPWWPVAPGWWSTSRRWPDGCRCRARPRTGPASTPVVGLTGAVRAELRGTGCACRRCCRRSRVPSW